VFDVFGMLQQNKGCSSLCGPVAQLGARFHGMEEVIGSIPIRSTKITSAKSASYSDPLLFHYQEGGQGPPERLPAHLLGDPSSSCWRAKLPIRFPGSLGLRFFVKFDKIRSFLVFLEHLQLAFR
jgi:hypothetical protein